MASCLGKDMLSRRKKSEIHNRAKRLLGAFSSEARKQALVSGQRKLIRAQCENGLLHLKEDFVRLPYSESQPTSITKPYNQANNPSKAMSVLFSRAKPTQTIPIDIEQLSPKEKLHVVVGEIVQMYSLQFKIIDELLGILKGELTKF
jgi:hypothetical protein